MNAPKNRTVVAVVIAAVVGCIGVLAAAYVVAFQPYISLKEERISTSDEIVRAVYVPFTCDPFFPRLYEVTGEEGGELRHKERGLHLGLPDTMPPPEDSVAAVGGNVFEMRGYRYQTTRKNALTGAEKVLPSSRVDIVSWKVEVPYKVRVKGKDGYPYEEEMREEPLGYVAEGLRDQGPDAFALQKYNDCP